ncbi:hypothetical protein SGPA1_31431 [Streptomyces misionensis JCM 4497]
MEGSAHGDDGSGEGRDLPAPRHPDLLQEGGGLRHSAVRRRPASGERAHRDRGGAGHRDGGAPPQAGHPGDLRAQFRTDRDGARRAAARLALRRQSRRGRRPARPADGPGRRPGPADPRAAPAGGLGGHLRRGGGLARGVPRARLADRARPLLLP